MTDGPVRSAHLHALKVAEEAGVLRSYDPNLRPPLWPNLEVAKENILELMGHCDILKISDNEIQWLSGKEDYDEGIAWLRERYDIPLIFLTLGKDGSRAYCGDIRTEQPGFKLATIETTGAGDTFFGSVLHHVLALGWRPYTKEELDTMLRFANAAAALVTTRRGALRVMPSKEEIAEVLA